LIGSSETADMALPGSDIIDANCLFGPWPRSHLDCSLGTVLRMLRNAGIDRALLGSLRSALHDHTAGNEEALAACSTHQGLLPVAGLRLGRSLQPAPQVGTLRAEGFRVLRLFREYEAFPMDYAPLASALRGAAESDMPVIIAALDPGDITALGRLLRDIPCKTIVTGVNTSHTPLVAEAIAVGREVASIFFETSRLEGTDTIDVMARELGPGRLVFGTAMPHQYPSSALALIDQCGLSDDDKTAVLGTNILRITGSQ